VLFLDIGVEERELLINNMDAVQEEMECLLEISEDEGNISQSSTIGIDEVEVGNDVNDHQEQELSPPSPCGREVGQSFM